MQNINEMDKDGLLSYAQALGVEIDARYSVDKIKQAISVALSKTEAKPVRMMELEIHKTDGDTGSIDVPVSVNGKTWLIKRGHKVVVPEAIVEILRNAVKEIFVPIDSSDITKGHERREVPAYPFTAMPV